MQFNHDFYEWNNARRRPSTTRGAVRCRPTSSRCSRCGTTRPPGTSPRCRRSPCATTRASASGPGPTRRRSGRAGSRTTGTSTSDLTLNLGLRWDFSYNWSGQQWDVPPLRQSVPNEFDNWGPRTGFAYSHQRQEDGASRWLGHLFHRPEGSVDAPHPARTCRTPSGRPTTTGCPTSSATPSAPAASNRRSGQFRQARKRCPDENILTCPSHPILRCDVAGYIATDTNKVPYSHQTSFGLQHQLTDTMSFQADYQWNAARREQVPPRTPTCCSIPPPGTTTRSS